MRTIRYLLPFLLFAGVAGVHAQPIIKITTNGGECDVTPSGGEIFRLDTNGNVLISGTMGTPVNTGCTGGGGTTNSPTFSPISAAALAVTPNSINAGTTTSPTSASVTYNAAYATSCSVSASAGTVTGGSGTCPALTVSNASCTGSGTNCVGNGSASEPTAFGTNLTGCSYTLTANCSPGPITSSTTLSVVASGGGGSGDPPPAACTDLHAIGTGVAGQTWSKVYTTTVIYNSGGSNKTGVDATSYVDIWSTPGATVPWPGNGGLTTRPNASVNMYFAEKFVVPTDGSVTTKPHWSWVGSGTNSNFSLTISECPGDFGQTGTHIQSYCKVNQAKSSNGLTSMVTATPVAGYCSLTPGKAYYLNVLPMASLPTGDVSTSDGCGSGCTPYMSMTQ